MAKKLIAIEGEFKEKLYVGEISTVYSFQTTENGVIEVGIYNSMQEPELNTPYEVDLLLHGVIRHLEFSDRIKNYLYVEAYYPVFEEVE